VIYELDRFLFLSDRAFALKVEKIAPYERFFLRIKGVRIVL